MYKRFILLIILVTVGLPGLVSAAGTVFTRDQCLQMALTRNPLVLASVERKTQAEWQKKSAYDNFLPKLNVDYSYTYLDDERDIDLHAIGGGDVSVTKRNNWAMSIYVDQPLFTGFRLLESYHLADLGLKTAVAEEQLAQLEISYQTVKAYYNFLMAQKLQKVAEAAVVELTSHLRDSQEFYENQIIPLNDLLQSKVHLANAKQDAEIAVGQTRTARMALANVIKEPLSRDFNVEDLPDMVALTCTVDALTRQALETRPELLRANYKLEASKKQITLARSAYYPDIYLSATHNRYGGNPWVDGSGLSDVQDSRESMIGVYASWELFAWGQTGHEVSKAQAASREVDQALTGVVDEIKLEVENNLIATVTSYKNIDTAQVAVEEARENLRMSELRYKNQLATNTNVLDARTLLTDTETKYYQALYGYNIQLAGLARAVGVKRWNDLTQK